MTSYTGKFSEQGKLNQEQHNNTGGYEKGSKINTRNTPSSLLQQHFLLVQEKLKEHKECTKLLSRKLVVKYKQDKLTHETDDDKLLNVFPEEIWTIILSQLTSTDDLQKCGMASKLFYKILNDRKPQWKFHEIAHVLHQYLPKPEFIKCRLVCKLWDNGVSEFFEKVEHYGSKNKFCSSPIEQASNHWKNVVSKYNQVQTISLRGSLEVLLEPTPGSNLAIEQSKNPFIGQSVELDIGVFETPQQTQAEMSRCLNPILNNFATHIRHLRLFVETFCNHFGGGDVQAFICVTILNGCPKLKSLRISFSRDFQTDFLVCQSTGTHLLPSHACLDTLSFLDEYVDTSELLQKLVEKYSSQLEYLKFDVVDMNVNPTLRWDKLTALSANADSVSSTDFATAISAPNLRRLTVNLMGEPDSIEPLMKLLQRFPKLELLKLKQCGSFLTKSDTAIFSLPNELCCSTTVKELQVKQIELHKTGFQMLRCFPLLQTLKIDHNWSFERMKNKQNDFWEDANAVIEPEYLFGDEDNSDRKCSLMFKSNVWKVLPKLLRLEIIDCYQSTSRVYTRDEYIYFQNQK